MPLGLLHQQPADPPLAHAGVHDEGHDPDDPIGVLEARQGVDRDEAEDLAVVSATMTRRVRRIEPAEPLDDVARAGRIALVGEERGDPLGVVGGRRAERDRVAFGHGGDGTGRTLDHDQVRTGDGTGEQRGPTGRTGPSSTRRDRDPGGRRPPPERVERIGASGLREAQVAAAGPLAVASERGGEAALGRGLGEREPTARVGVLDEHDARRRGAGPDARRAIGGPGRVRGPAEIAQDPLQLDGRDDRRLAHETLDQAVRLRRATRVRRRPVRLRRGHGRSRRSGRDAADRHEAEDRVQPPGDVVVLEHAEVDPAAARARSRRRPPAT